MGAAMVYWYAIYAGGLVTAFAVAAALTEAVRGAALRFGALDHPGERKMQQTPVPLLGGVAIVASFYVTVAACLLMLVPVRQLQLEWIERNVFEFLGTDVYWKLAGVAGGGLIVFLVGLVDDLRVLTPEKKLVGQILAAFALTVCGVRLDLFLPQLGWPDWATTLLASGITMVWVVFMMNSLNFLDNMDGLCAGVSAIAASTLFLSVMPQDTFVCVLLAVFAGSLCGFLYHNFSPARIYMGDAGSMFCGYILATSAVLATFYTEMTPTRVAVCAPVIALSVPIFDTVSVIWIRWRHGESIMKGDKRHFSHRLVHGGMSPQQAVVFIYLVTGLTGLSAVLLRQANTAGTLVILTQVVGVFGLIALLMSADSRRRRGE